LHNVLYKRVAGPSGWPGFAKTPPNLYFYCNVSTKQRKLLSDEKEAQIQLAIKALKQDATLTIYRAAATYNVPERTLRRRRAGTPYRRDCAPKSMALGGSEEVAIIKHALKLSKQGYPPRLADVEEMANSLLTIRHQKVVGKNWAANFVKRRSELKVKFNRKYDHSRALCEDLEVI
jgi:hypothetical protein